MLQSVPRTIVNCQLSHADPLSKVALTRLMCVNAFEKFQRNTNGMNASTSTVSCCPNEQGTQTYSCSKKELNHSISWKFVRSKDSRYISDPDYIKKAIMLEGRFRIHFPWLPTSFSLLSTPCQHHASKVSNNGATNG